ncbi:protein LURP-one-related 7 isoform X2 [Punica granatum]|uniref:Protein LURP-one-related 7 isoform X2 n=1 Tax=Punica granatum TaxID=22663 RepID=A0A6P8DNB9_PUNGR|nr:protein LURP-one-related 7 isoform X2 [Punica granatum]
MDDSAPAYPAIPIDLFGSKKHRGLAHGELGFADSSGNIVFRVKRQSSRSSSESHHRERMLLDTAGNPLFSICRDSEKSWKVFKVDDGQEKQIILTAQRTRRTLTRTELDVFCSDENLGDSSPSLKMKGFPFQRSCTICRGDSIVAQDHVS